MKFLIILIALSNVGLVHAEVGNTDVDGSIEKMVKENVISESVAKRIRRNSPWTALDKNAVKIAARGPASVQEEGHAIAEVHAKDLEVAQFRAIQHEMKRIMHR